MNYEDVRGELLSGHPGTGAYSLDDATAAAELNAANRPNARTSVDVFEYFLSRQHRTQQGGDSANTTLLGRLIHAAESNVGSDPFSRGAGHELNIQQKHGCLSLLEWLRRSDSAMETLDANLRLGYVNGAGVISVGQRAEIEAMSADQISRGVELGFGHVDPEDVTTARNI